MNKIWPLAVLLADVGLAADRQLDLPQSVAGWDTIRIENFTSKPFTVSFHTHKCRGSATNRAFICETRTILPHHKHTWQHNHGKGAAWVSFESEQDKNTMIEIPIPTTKTKGFAQCVYFGNDWLACWRLCTRQDKQRHGPDVCYKNAFFLDPLK